MAIKASVVVPVYNKAPYLTDCFESIFAQSFTEFEVIAVDDASTDNSLEVLRSFNDPRVRILSNPVNSGPGVTAQNAMDQAKGEYIIRVDADDVLLSHRFKEQIAFMDAHPEIGISGANISILGLDEVIKRPTAPNDCKVQLLFGVAVMQPTSIYRRSVLVEHDLRYQSEWPRYGEDWMFQARAGRQVLFANSDDVTVRYRRGEQGISFGRDRSDELPECINFAFSEFGWPLPSDAEMNVHLWSLNIFPEPPTGHSVKFFREWLNKMERINSVTGTFDPVALHERIEDIWRQLLYKLPEHGKEPLRAYLKEGGALDLRRVYFVLRTMLSARTKINTPKK